MFTPTQSPSRKYIEMDNLDLDCPSSCCDGWLIGYTDQHNDGAQNVPAFLKCSNKNCIQRTVLAKYPSRCKVCSQAIACQEIITKGTNEAWVHVSCFSRLNEELQESLPTCFAVCQRCKQPIEEEYAACSSVCNGKIGHRHLKCPKKRTAGFAGFDEEFNNHSSQDSLESSTPSSVTSSTSVGSIDKESPTAGGGVLSKPKNKKTSVQTKLV